MMPAVAPNRKRIVFDIDEVLCDVNKMSIEDIAFYDQFGYILTALKTHYIYPGVIELMQAVFNEKDVDVSFFSRGDKERNHIFVGMLLIRALGQECYLQVKSRVLIHTVKPKIYVGDPPENKDLAIYYKLTLDETILVDDNRENIAPGQHMNFLYVLDTVFRFSARSDENGYIYSSVELQDYKCTFTPPRMTHITPKGKRSYLSFYKSRTIKVRKSKRGLIVKYIDKKTREVAKLLLSREQHPELVSRVFKISAGDWSIRKQDERAEILMLVEQAGGVTKRIEREANRIFHVTGLIFSALAQSRATNTPLSHILYNLQWRVDTNYDGEQLVHFSDLNETYEEKGLEILRRYNPNLEFMTERKFNSVRSLPITSEKRTEYANYMRKHF